MEIFKLSKYWQIFLPYLINKYVIFLNHSPQLLVKEYKHKDPKTRNLSMKCQNWNEKNDNKKIQGCTYNAVLWSLVSIYCVKWKIWWQLCIWKINDIFMMIFFTFNVNTSLLWKSLLLTDQEHNITLDNIRTFYNLRQQDWLYNKIK